MDEITMFAELKPDGPPDAEFESMRAVARQRFVESALRVRDQRRWRRPVLAGAVTATVSATAVLALALTSGPGAARGHAGTVVTAVWTVREDASGVVTLRMRQFADLDRLQQVLRADGINAIVRPFLLTPRTVRYVKTCYYSHANDAPRAVQRAVVTYDPQAGDFIIRPAAMPEGSALFLVGSVSHDSSGTWYGGGDLVVLNNNTVPACKVFTSTPLPSDPAGPPGSK